MITRFCFNVEAEDLHRPGFSFGYVVAQINEKTNAITIIEQGDCHSIEGAEAACDWVKENVIPSIAALQSCDLHALPSNIVRTNRELRDVFYSIYEKYKTMNAEFWGDVNFPVITNFLSAIVKDVDQGRDFVMPYPLRDLSNFLDVNVNRMEYCGFKGLTRHNPAHDALCILYSLQKIENELKTTPQKKPAITSGESRLRFVFDVGAQALQFPAFSYGYVVTRMDKYGLQVLEKGLCMSIDSARQAKVYVLNNTIPHLKVLHSYLHMDNQTLKKTNLPPELVVTADELKEKFYEAYTRWRHYGADVYSSDVNYPVETNFLTAIVQDGKGSRNWEMPYPLSDISSLLNVEVSRADYTGLNDLKKGNPLHHALSSSCALHMCEARQGNTVEAADILVKEIREKYQEHVQPMRDEIPIISYKAMRSHQKEDGYSRKHHFFHKSV